MGQFIIKGLTPPFGAVVEKMKAGEVSEPVLSEHGFHLIKVLEKQDNKTLTFDEMQDSFKNYLYQEQVSPPRLNDYLNQVSARTFIVKKL